MQFIFNNIQANFETYKYKLLWNARLLIISHKLTPGETNLNNYLIKTYKTNLKAISLYLISKAKIYRDFDNNVIVLFPDKRDDKLAAFITYGNNEVSGSNILKKAFFRDI